MYKTVYEIIVIMDSFTVKAIERVQKEVKERWFVEVLGISLQGQRMVIALGVQDFVDRKDVQHLRVETSQVTPGRSH